MSISEADYFAAQRRFDALPKDRFYEPLGLKVAPDETPGMVVVSRGGDTYTTPVADFEIDLSAEVLQNHLVRIVGQQARGGASLLEVIEAQIRAEKAAESAA